MTFRRICFSSDKSDSSGRIKELKEMDRKIGKK